MNLDDMLFRSVRRAASTLVPGDRIRGCGGLYRTIAHVEIAPGAVTGYCGDSDRFRFRPGQLVWTQEAK